MGVQRTDLESFSWLQSAEFHGLEGMVDVRFPASQRTLILKFSDLGAFADIDPIRPAVLSRRGVPIAHPVDLLASTLCALSKRKVRRDFLDIAAAAQELPEELNRAIVIFLDSHLTRESSRLDLAKTLQNYPIEVEFSLEKKHLEALDQLASDLFASS